MTRRHARGDEGNGGDGSWNIAGQVEAGVEAKLGPVGLSVGLRVVGHPDQVFIELPLTLTYQVR